MSVRARFSALDSSSSSALARPIRFRSGRTVQREFLSLAMLFGPRLGGSLSMELELPSSATTVSEGSIFKDGAFDLKSSRGGVGGRLGSRVPGHLQQSSSNPIISPSPFVVGSGAGRGPYSCRRAPPDSTVRVADAMAGGCTGGGCPASTGWVATQVPGADTVDGAVEPIAPALAPSTGCCNAACFFSSTISSGVNRGQLRSDCNAAAPDTFRHCWHGMPWDLCPCCVCVVGSYARDVCPHEPANPRKQTRLSMFALGRVPGP